MAWKSELRPREVVIGDTDPTPVVPGGMSRGYEGRDYSRFPVGYSSRAIPFDLPIVPQSEWDDRIAEMERSKTRLSDMLIQAEVPCKDQNGTNYCWINGVVTAVETLRCYKGLPYVELSPASGGAPIKGFRNQGGWGGEALEWISTNGICSAATWPCNAIDRRYYTDDAKAEAKQYRITEWFDVDANDFAALMSMLFYRIPCPLGLDWWGHLICACDPVKIDANSYGTRIRNSWGMDWGSSGFGVLSKNKSLGDVVAPRSVTAVDKAA